MLQNQRHARRWRSPTGWNSLSAGSRKGRAPKRIRVDLVTHPREPVIQAARKCLRSQDGSLPLGSFSSGPLSPLSSLHTPPPCPFPKVPPQIWANGSDPNPCVVATCSCGLVAVLGLTPFGLDEEHVPFVFSRTPLRMGPPCEDLPCSQGSST